MNARMYHETAIGQKVLASIGTSEHVAKILGKDNRKRRFLLRFHLVNGDAREQWRSSLRCKPTNGDSPMGPAKNPKLTERENR